MICIPRSWLALAIFPLAAHSPSVHGFVRDSHGAALADATVRLGISSDADVTTKAVHTDQTGGYHFASLEPGDYTIRVEKAGFEKATLGPFHLEENQSKIVDLVLKPEADSVYFVDEPKFTVAGVTDHAYMGGHGSDAVQLSAEELTRATGALRKDPTSSTTPPKATEQSLRRAIASDAANFQANDQLGRLLSAAGRYPEAITYLARASQLRPGDAELHRLLAIADENASKPLDAVHEFQRAAELDSSELNLFDWGTELLVHQASTPALEVFKKGFRLHPDSSRMLLGAGTAAYAQRDYSSAAKYFLQASDINPNDAQPYLFLGKLAQSNNIASDDCLDRMARFARLQPQNAWANYYYAVNLWAQRNHGDESAAVLSLLEKATRIDPQMAVAYLQLGIVNADQRELSSAIRFFHKAIEIDPGLEQAHYRLAQAYRQSNDFERAKAEDAIFEQLSKSSAQELARERAQLQRFIINLKASRSAH